MMRFATGVLCTVLVVLTSLVLIPHAGSLPQAAEGADGPAPRFAMSAGGLPDSGNWKSTPLLVDINRDGHLDVLAVNRLGDGAHVWLGDGKGNWRDASRGLTARNSACGGGIAHGDINKDGLLDLAVGDHCSGVYVYLQQPDGSWTAVVEGLAPALSKKAVPSGDPELLAAFIGVEDIALGDINEDGCLDIVAAASDRGGFGVYLGDCTGRTWKPVLDSGLPNADNPEPGDTENAGWANRVVLTDLNKDGHLDVVASYYRGPRVWLGDGKGTFKNASDGLPQPPIGGLYRGLAFGDVNEDGLLDIAAANDIDGPEVYLQQPNGSWKVLDDLMPSMQNGAVGIALGDFRGSGHLDIVVAGRQEEVPGNNYGLYYLQGDGKGEFKELHNTGLPAKGLSVTWGLAAGDVNEDGRPDFVAATGGAVAGPDETRTEKPASADNSTEATTDDFIPELPLPRMQAWVNQGVK